MEPGSIRIHRARRAFRLLGEAGEIGWGTEAARRHLVEGLLADVGAVIGGAVRDEAFRVGGRKGCVQATLAGFDASTAPVYQVHDEDGSDFNPCLRAVMVRHPRPGQVFTTTQRDIVPTLAWERSLWVNEYARPARVSHFLASLRFLGEARVNGFGLMRAAGDAPFTEEDRDFVHLLHLEIPVLFDEATPPAARVELGRAVPRLAPRVEQTLEALLTGASDKEIACRLDLSPHTVRQYVKKLYRAYGVSSRGQLLALHASGTIPMLRPPADSLI